MEEKSRFIKKTDDCVEVIVDSTLTIPVKMGDEVFCTINFMKHRMDLVVGEDGQYTNQAQLTKEIVSSITLTEAHALELSDIIKSQIAGIREQSEKHGE